MTMETRSVPGLGLIVQYTLTSLDAEAIAQRRAAAQLAAANPPHLIGPSGADVHAGDIYAAVVVRVRSLDGALNLQVLLDGNDTLWVEHVEEGTTPGHWSWPGL